MKVPMVMEVFFRAIGPEGERSLPLLGGDLMRFTVTASKAQALSLLIHDILMASSPEIQELIDSPDPEPEPEPENKLIIE